MTNEQRAELEQLDTAIAAAPEAYWAFDERAHFFVRENFDVTLALTDLKEGLRSEHRQDYIHTRAELRRWPSFLICRGREAWKFSRIEREEFVSADLQIHKKLQELKAIAAFELALEDTHGVERWRTIRPANWSSLGSLELVASFDKWKQIPDWENANVEDYETWAIAIAIARGFINAADAFKWGVLMKLGESFSETRSATLAHKARNRELEDYKQLAWWSLTILREQGGPSEDSPLLVKYLIERARWFRRHDKYTAARKDFSRALKIAPNDPRIYEARAKAITKRKWWRSKESAVADYVQAIRLRMREGQIAETPERLVAQAEQLWPAIKKGKRRKRAHARAFAFYGLASYAQPGTPSFYLARARIILAIASSPPLWNKALDEDEERAIYILYLHALEFDPTLEEAHGAVVQYLIKTLPRETAHERIESLLSTRQELLEFGLEAKLVGQILGEVESALAV